MDDQGAQYTATTAINVLDGGKMATLLQEKWASMKALLGQGDVEGALGFFTPADRERYRTIFTGMWADLPQVVQDMANIQLIYVTEKVAKCRLRRTETYGGQAVTFTYYVYFRQDPSGAWQIEGF